MVFVGDDIRIGIAICAIALFVFIPIIDNNAGDSVIFVDDKIESKRKTVDLGRRLFDGSLS